MSRWTRSFSNMYSQSFKPNPKVSASSLRVFREVPQIRDFRLELLRSKRSVGLVPTMGALHEGHLSLIRHAARENTDVFVSIYVNPTQFGVNEDLDSYPKTWEADLQVLEALDQELARKNADETSGQATRGRISAIFAPTNKTMYPTLPPASEPEAQGSFVTITPLASRLEGKSRPTFFRGVATVCMKLFNITTPERVYFGQKDIQQTIVIKRMVRDFAIGTEVVVVPTTREIDGLAMSSRNVYLGYRRRQLATVLSKALRAAETQYSRGDTSRDNILKPAMAVIRATIEKQLQLQPSERAIFEVDYISLADPGSLEEIQELDKSRGAILSGAIKMLPLEKPQPAEDCGLGGGVSSVRLIDNLILEAEV